MSRFFKSSLALTSSVRRTFATEAAVRYIRPPKITSFEQNDSTRLITVNWEDGTQLRYPYPWLRENAPNDETYNFGGRNTSRHYFMTRFDPKISPITIEEVPDGQGLYISWPDVNKNPTLYSTQWLLDRPISDENYRKRRRVGYYYRDYLGIGKENSKQLLEPSADYAKLMQDDRYMWSQLKRFLKQGIIHFNNVPTKSGTLLEFGERLGYLFPTQYGTNDDLTYFQTKVSSGKPSYPVEIGLDANHCHEASPDTQILHCIAQNGEGGEFRFADGFRVADQIRAEKPEVFDILTKYRVQFTEYGKLKYKFEYAGLHPTIEVDPNGTLTRIFYSDNHRSWFFDAPTSKYPEIYDALKTFAEYCHQDKNVVEVRLEPGEMIMVHTIRMVWGKPAFDPNGGKVEKNLESAFLDPDVVKSRTRRLEVSLGERHDFIPV